MSHSTAHEALLVWLREAPALVGELLRLLVPARDDVQWQVDDSALRKAYPSEARPDLAALVPETNSVQSPQLSSIQRPAPFFRTR